MNFSKLTEVLGKLEGISGRLEMTDVVAEFLGGIPDDFLPVICLFLKGEVFPMWSDMELGIGENLMVKSISMVSGLTEEKIKDMVREKGDMGLVAEEILVNKPQTTLFFQELTVEKAHENLTKLATLTGKGSQDKKLAYITELLSSASSADSRYVVRLILGELRLGVGDGIIRDAIAKTFGVGVELVERAYYLTSDLGEVAKIAKTRGENGLRDVKLTPGRPIKVMLAQKAENINEVLGKFGETAFEIKYDGARVQVHKKGDKIELYTRRLENVTKQFPEVREAAEKNIKADEAIVEGEIVAINSIKDRRPKAFQELSRRIKRKYDIDAIREKIPVEANLFDLTYLDGESKLDTKFSERRRLLEDVVTETDVFRLAEQLVTDDPKRAEEFYKHALKLGHEGVMAKNLDAPYQPGSRVGYMYKIKPVMESLDLIITGATWGEGRRAQWLGSFLLSVYDPATGEFQTIGRMATGLSDVQLEEMTELLKPTITSQSGKEVELRPTTVVEVAYEEIQKSPTYTSGYALRFPRMVRVRNDKGPEDADTPEKVESLIRVI